MHLKCFLSKFSAKERRLGNPSKNKKIKIEKHLDIQVKKNEICHALVVFSVLEHMLQYRGYSTETTLIQKRNLTDLDYLFSRFTLYYHHNLKLVETYWYIN